MIDDPEFWKRIGDFLENLVSDTLAPWVNRFLPYLVSPALKMIRTHTPAVRRVAAGQAREVSGLIRQIPKHSRNLWLWPMLLTIPIGIGMEATQWGGMAELAGGALASVYVCAGAYLIVRGGVERIARLLQ